MLSLAKTLSHNGINLQESTIIAMWVCLSLLDKLKFCCENLDASLRPTSFKMFKIACFCHLLLQDAALLLFLLLLHI
jgi:hypothetical protein